MLRYLLIIGLLTASCGSEQKRFDLADLGTDTSTPDAALPDTSDTTDATPTLPDRCTAGTVWSPGQPAFRDASADWGLTEINAEGVRISAADLDGDGWLDLFARRAGLKNDRFEENTRATWLLRNTGNRQFEDITRSSGLVRGKYEFDDKVGRPADVTVFGDIDNDGDLDAFSGFTNDGTVAEGAVLMLNNGNATFEPYGPAVDFHKPLTKEAIGGAAFTDINRDGRLDLWIGYGAVDNVPQQDRLYVQQPDGRFVDETIARGLGSRPWSSPEDLNNALAHTNAWSAAACDLNNDGTPELLSSSYGRAPNHLWLSSPDRYLNHSKASGYAYDNNQDWSDNLSARCYCEANRTAAGCESVPSPGNINCSSVRGWNHERDTQAFRLGGNSGTTVCADLNNDGHLDLLTTEIVHWDVGANSDASDILLNDGHATFTRPGQQNLGLTRTRPPGWNDGDITAAILDFDNDGRNDILVASTDYPDTRAHLYHQQSDGTFQAVPPNLGIDLTSAHGVVTGDFDRDGDLDLIVGHSANRCSSGSHCLEPGARHIRLFENLSAQNGNAIQILLEGTSANRAAIGARLTASYNGTLQAHEVQGGHGHYGLQNDRLVHVGLGTACTADITVRWPNAEGGEAQATLQAGYRYLWREGQPPTVLP